MISTTHELRAVKAPLLAERADRLQRVLYAINMDPTRKFGSLEEQMVVLAREFRARGSLFLPLFTCPEPAGPPTQWDALGVPVECLDLQRFRWSSLWRLVRLVRRHRIEVLHWNFSEPLSNRYLWLLTLLAPTVKHYYTDHVSRAQPLPPPARLLKRSIKRLLMKRYRRVICVSEFIQDCNAAGRGKWSNLCCRLHFINTDRFRPDPAVRTAVRRRLNAGQQFVTLVVGQLIREKGIDVAVRALAQLPEPIVLWVIGEGAEAAALRDLTDHLGLKDRVVFLGLQRNVEPYLQAADCFLCPSRWAEAAGLVNLEAQACGLPVVASRIGGIPEYVEDGRTGLLFAAEDHRQLADRIRCLQGDPDLCRAMGEAARARAVERFSAESRINDYLDLYRCP
jgi:glycosyltransferase involved in cell wall biosynthesis